jgi:hypothetical protein
LRIIWGAGLLVLIVAAVVGGVLGSKAKRNSSPSTTASKRMIAALSFVSSDVNQTRVYYQDNTGILIEAATSADSSTWTNKALNFSAVNGSAMAAAVSRPGFPLVCLIQACPNISDNIPGNQRLLYGFQLSYP